MMSPPREIQAGDRVTWKKGHPTTKPFPPNHLIFDAVGKVLRFTAPGIVLVEWSCPVHVPGDLRPVWTCHVGQLELAVFVPGAPPPGGGRA